MEAALKHFAEVLRLDPDHTASRKMRQRIKELERVKEAGKEACQAGKYKEAAELYTQALAVDPDALQRRCLEASIVADAQTSHVGAGMKC